MRTKEESFDWLVQLHEEQGATLHRLAVLLGAESESGRIVRSAMLALYRRGHRLIDPAERVEFLQEHVVHLARAVRPTSAKLALPTVEEPRQEEILSALSSLPVRMSELLVVSHYLSVFGPELAGIVRMSVRGCNEKLEQSLEALRAKVGDPTPGSQPGVIESLSQEVTAALRSAARQVQPPGTSTLAEELQELTRSRSFTIGPKLVAAAVVASVVAGLVLAAWIRPTAALLEPLAAPDASAARGAATESLPALVRGIPLYYVGRQDGKLYQESRDLPATGNLVRTAMESLMSLAPLDPDYRSVWSSSQLLSSELDGDTLTLDLAASSYEDITTPQLAQQAIDQVVYTQAEIVGHPLLRVKFLADGADPPEWFRSETGFQRHGISPMPEVWITSPRNTAQLAAGNVVILGMVKPDASVPIVTVTNIETDEIVAQASAQTTTSPNAEGWRLWSVSLPLTAGSYDIRAAVVSGPDATPSTENKSIRVA